MAGAILLCGLPGSGKTNARREIATKVSATGVEASETLRTLMIEHQFATTQELFSVLGKAAVAKAIISKHESSELLVISGFREQSEVDSIRESRDSLVVWLAAEADICEKRLMKRDGLTCQESRSRVIEESNRLASIRQACDEVLVLPGNISKARNKIAEWVASHPRITQFR